MKSTFFVTHSDAQKEHWLSSIDFHFSWCEYATYEIRNVFCWFIPYCWTVESEHATTVQIMADSKLKSYGAIALIVCFRYYLVALVVIAETISVYCVVPLSIRIFLDSFFALKITYESVELKTGQRTHLFLFIFNSFNLFHAQSIKMCRSILFLVSLVLLIAVHECKVVPFESCGVSDRKWKSIEIGNWKLRLESLTAKCTIQEVRIVPCRGSSRNNRPCEVKRGKSANIEFDYTTGSISLVSSVCEKWKWFLFLLNKFCSFQFDDCFCTSICRLRYIRRSVDVDGYRCVQIHAVSDQWRNQTNVQIFIALRIQISNRKSCLTSTEHLHLTTHGFFSVAVHDQMDPAKSRRRENQRAMLFQN